MSSWEDELDIDDSDILGVFSKKGTSHCQSAGSQRHSEFVANEPESCYSTQQQHELASGFLSRFQKPHSLQNLSRNSGPNLPEAAEGLLDKFSVDPVRKRKRDGNKDAYSTPRSIALPTSEAIIREGLQLENNQDFDENIGSRYDEGRRSFQAFGKEHHHAGAPSASIRGFQPATDHMQQKKTGQEGISRRSHTFSNLADEEDVLNRSSGRGFMEDVEVQLLNNLNDGRRSHSQAETGPSHLKRGEEPDGSTSRSAPEKHLSYLIPGPAGAVQRALAQKIHHSLQNDKGGRNDPAPRRRDELRTSILDDADFRNGAWLSAINYLEKISSSASTISAIKMPRTENRIPKLVAVIKTCTPNGCGDVSVNLKDRSGSIGGTIHRRVMTETEFGRDIEPGAVILLHQVAVFSPTPYAHYLNITINNVEQVFGKGLQCPKEQHSAGRISKCKVSFTGAAQMHTPCHDQSQLEPIAEEMSAQFFPAKKNVTGAAQMHTPCRDQSQLEPMAEEMSAQFLPAKQTALRDDQNCRSEDDIGILHVISSHQGEILHDHIEENSQLNISIVNLDNRDPRGIVSSAPAHPNDGYDQLLDDTDLFQCLKVRSSAS